MAVEDVPYAPPGGVERDVPACELDAERVKAGAEPDSRMVMVGGERVPYWQGGRAYAPYAAGYFGGFGPMEWMFMGVMFGGGFDGLGDGLGDLARRHRRRHRRRSATASAGCSTGSTSEPSLVGGRAATVTRPGDPRLVQ